MTYASLRAAAAAYARRALAWVASVSLTAAPQPEQEREADEAWKDTIRDKHVEDLDVWMRRSLWTKRKERRP